jgi:Polyketide cyclase / dehydrase and lipid transport
MRDLRASGEAVVDVPPARCLELLSDIDGYARWYPDVVRQASVTERDRAGRPTAALVVLRLGVGPLTGTFPLLMRVAVGRAGVDLQRVPHEPSDREHFRVTWEVEAAQPTRLRLAIQASLELPRLVPLGGIGETLAQGFVEAARRELAGTSPNASASNS